MTKLVSTENSRNLPNGLNVNVLYELGENMVNISFLKVNLGFKDLLASIEQ